MRWILPSIVIGMIGGCALVHERSNADAGDAVTTFDATTRPDAWLARPDAVVVHPDTGPRPDAWSPPPPPHCFDIATMIVAPPPDRAFFEHVITGDLDGDGRDEIIAIGRDEPLPPNPSLHVYAMTGLALGERWRTSAHPGSGYPYGMRAHDIDADGDLDVITEWGGVRIFENREGTLFERPAFGSTSASGAGWAFEVDDFDFDGDADITHYGVDNEATIFLQEGGAFREEVVGGTPISTGLTSTQMLHAAGLTTQRIVVAGTDVDFVGVYERVGSTWQLDMQLGTYRPATGLAAADFDGDGYEDFVLAQSAGHAPQFHRQAPDGSFSLGFEGDPAVGFAVATVVLDYDHDGDPDVLIGNFSTGTMWLYESTGGFGFAEHRILCDFADATAGSLFEVAVGDVDGDGQLDLVTTTHGRGIALFSNFVARLFLL